MYREIRTPDHYKAGFCGVRLRMDNGRLRAWFRGILGSKVRLNTGAFGLVYRADQSSYVSCLVLFTRR